MRRSQAMNLRGAREIKANLAQAATGCAVNQGHATLPLSIKTRGCRQPFVCTGKYPIGTHKAVVPRRQSVHSKLPNHRTTAGLRQQHHHTAVGIRQPILRQGKTGCQMVVQQAPHLSRCDLGRSLCRWQFRGAAPLRFRCGKCPRGSILVPHKLITVNHRRKQKPQN